MSTSPFSIFSNIILSISSAFAIWNSLHYPFAVAGFFLYLLNGFLGIASCGKNEDEKLKKLYQQSLSLSYALCLPLFGSQVCLTSNGCQWNCYLLQIIPISDILFGFFENSKPKTLDFFHSFNLAVIVYTWQIMITQVLIGFVFSLLSFYLNFMINLDTLQDEKTQNKYNLVATITSSCLYYLLN